MGRTHRRWLATLAAAVAVTGAACGSTPQGPGAAQSVQPPDSSSQTTVTSSMDASSTLPDTTFAATTTPVASTDLPAVETIEVDCGEEPHGESAELVTSQEMVFDGIVEKIAIEPNPQAEFRLAYLDDGHEDPGGPVPDESALDDPNAGALWPWTTFAVQAWFTPDRGTEIKIWTAGLDLAVGDRVLIAGEAFLTAIPENVPTSGMAVVCASVKHSPELARQWAEWFDGSVAPGANDPEGDPDPAAIAEIEAGRALWEHGAPVAYTATLRVNGSRLTDDPCPLVGAVQVMVVERQAVSAVNLEVGCRIDVSAVDVPTIDDFFDQAIVAQAAAGEHDVVLDPVWGFPSQFYGYDRSLDISGEVSTFHPAATETLLHSDIAASLASLRQRWAATGSAAYGFTLHRLCFAPPADRSP